MAIQVNGTTVIDNSRALTNIASVDATTAAAIGAAGVGGGTLEWQTVASSSLDTTTRYDYTSPAIGVTMPNWEELQGFGLEFSFDAYRASPDGYTGYIFLYLPAIGFTPTDSGVFYITTYVTFNSGNVDTWHNNQKVFVGWQLDSRYDLVQNSSGGSTVNYNYNQKYFTKSSGTIFVDGGYSGYLTIPSASLNSGESFNMYYRASDGYSNFRIRNAQMKFLAKYY